MQPSEAALDPEIEWVESARPDYPRGRFGLVNALGDSARRADVLRVGLDDVGVTFVRSSGTVRVRWAELIPSRTQVGHGVLVLMAREGTTSPDGGPWVVDREQALAILRHPGWTDAPFAATAVHAWLG